MKKTFKKIIATLLVVVVCLTSAPISKIGFETKAANYGGECGEQGDNVVWELNTDTKTLTISGTGKMLNFATNEQGLRSPWYPHRMYIENVVVNDGIEIISGYSFYDCYNMKTIYISKDVWGLGVYSFYGCTSLKEIKLPNSITTIGDYAFDGCSGITDVYYEGMQEQWENIKVYRSNQAVTQASIHYNYNQNNTQYKVGDIIQFGSYPQTKVSDETLISELNAIAPVWDEWTSYGYYSGNGEYGSMVQGDWMRYVDIIYNGKTYRGVRFTQYRPDSTYRSPSTTSQISNGYLVDTSYWFLFEPIKWRVLDIETGLVLSEKIIDAQAFSDTAYETSNGCYNDKEYTTFASDYSSSSIRTWLNNHFYSTSFSFKQKENINGEVYLLTRNDIVNTNYGFSSSLYSYDNARKTSCTDYAAAQGCGIYSGNSHWWLNSKYHDGAVYLVGNNGYAGYEGTYVPIVDVGVRPAMNLKTIIDYSNGGSSGGNSGSTDEPDTPDEPKPDGYKLRLRSDGAYSDSIAVGETISFWTFLSNNGKSVNCERAYAISFDNPGIFDVVETEITEPSFDVTLKAKKVGTTNMTVSDNVTGAYVTIKLKANNPVDVLTMDDVKKLATEEYGGITTYFYNINGLYINNYSYSENKDGTYNVKMTAYNEKAHYGAVVSYDKNGNIHKFKVINPKDKLPENLWDGLYDSFDYVNYKLDDWFGDTNYTDIGWTQRTPITIEVPEGGYFEITNKYFNEIVFMTNVIDLTIDLAFAVNDLPEIGIKGATVETVKQLFIKIGSKGIEKLCKKIFKEYSKGIGFENIYDVIFDVAELTKEYDVDFFKIITENINYEELIMDSVESAVLSVIAKPVKEVLDGFGYINTLIKCGDFFNSSLASEVVVYTPAEEPYKRESSGVKVTSETPLDPDYVLHSYIINEADDVMADAKPTIEALASNYTMYDITLYKSGAAVQPNAKIKVMIPIPADYNKNNIQIYWYKEDGTLQSMNAVVQGDYAVFETDHLSYYVLIDHSHSDENHDGICDTCGYDATENCSCKCHNDGFFAKIIWKIINFFNKLLRRNQECECGFYHY